ncbi:amino acid transporter [Trichophyton violaceum]|uniref:Amino acid transporter n=1 Tax=Trichophyton violaceum TaxID=34388 RepID=A0A178FE40_TRIVO|nr:amino acid transporter [Trichophyton violaceum]
MNRGDKLDVRTAEASKYSEEEGRSLLSHGSHEDDDYLIVEEPSSTSGTPSSQSASTPKIPPSLSTSPTDQPRTGRTSNRVRFDIQDDGEEDTVAVMSTGLRTKTTLMKRQLNVTVATSDFIPEDHLENARPRSGLGSAFMNMANSIIGAGIIGQPYAFRQAGLTTGIILLVILTWTVDWTIRLIVVNSKLSGADSFQSTLEFCYGRTGLIAISVAQWAFAFGGMIAFCIIVGDTIPHVVMGIAPSIRDMPVLWLLTDRRAVIIIFVLGISYPLSLYRDIAKLAKASTFALVSMLVILITVIIEGIQVAPEARGEVKGSLFVNSGVVPAIGVISFAFVCHHNSLLIYGSLRKPTMDRFARVTHYSTAISMVMCLVMAVAGFLTFGSKTKGNILNNFPPDNVIVNIARLFFGLNMLATLPLEAFVCRSVMTTFYFPEEPFNLNRHLIFTTSLVVTSMVMALITCDLGAVLELIGATSACALAYILPPLCYIKLSKQSWVAKIPAVLCIAFGTVVMCISVLQTAAKMIKHEGGAVTC